MSWGGVSPRNRPEEKAAVSGLGREIKLSLAKKNIG